MRNNYFYIESHSLYQVIGHVPLGYSASIDKYTDGKLTTYLINLDASNTFYSSNANKMNNHNILSNTILTENRGIKSVISLDLQNIPLVLFNNFKFNESLDKGNLKYNEHLIISSDLYARLENLGDYRFNINISFTELAGIDKITDQFLNRDLVINYQGITIDNKITYYVMALSCKTARFQKNLLILNKTDFDFFTNVESDVMKHKYLKYKMKYLNLAKELNIVHP